MNDIKTMGSVANKLIDYVDTAVVRDSNYSIAEIMIRNYQKLKGMSISEVADLCFVSKASISRFCRLMGFESFKEFQDYLDVDFDIHTDYSQQFYNMFCQDKEMALAKYRDQLISNIYATISPENLEVVEDVVRTIHASRRVACFSHHFLWDIGHHFQGKMMAMNRFVEMYHDYTAQMECAQSLGKEDLAITITVGGSYMNRYAALWNTIQNSGSKLLVVTQNFSNACLNQVDYVLQCGYTNRDDVGKYSALMAMDLIVMAYMKRYSPKLPASR